MDTALQALLSYQFILLCLAIASVTFVEKTLIQYFILDNPKMPGNRKSALWTEVILPISPVFIGVVATALIHGSIYPDDVKDAAGRIEFGLVGGLLSGLVYRVAWGMIKSKLPSGVVGVVVSDSPPQLTNEELSKLTDNVTSTGANSGIVITNGSASKIDSTVISTNKE